MSGLASLAQALGPDLTAALHGSPVLGRGLAALVMVGVAGWLADEWAHRDELAARRFRELPPTTVAGALDEYRNLRWHRVGFRQRLETVLLASSVVLVASGSWWAGAVAFGLMGAVVALVFDISFNLRLGLPWWYAGTTAWFDEWLYRLGVAYAVPAGKIAAAVELAAALGAAAAWLLWI